MQLRYTKNYEKTYKKLNKYNKEKNNLNNIIGLLENYDNFNDVIKDPILTMYGFEQLKFELNEFYSFNLNKHGGVVRLLVKPTKDYLILYLVHISYNHYKDFNIKKGDIDEE